MSFAPDGTALALGGQLGDIRVVEYPSGAVRWQALPGDHWNGVLAFSPDGSRLACLAWDHPRMPWDGTELLVTGWSADGPVPRRAGGPTESIFQPAQILFYQTRVLEGGDRELRLLGRGGAEDIRQIEEPVAVARNFIALTDPRSVRIAGLSLLDGPPAELPDGFAGRGADLSWLALRSPDLRLTLDRAPTSAANRAPLYRALIGSDPLTGRIEFAIVQRDDGPRRIERTTLLLQLRGHFERDGFQVPREIRIYGADPTARPRRFQSVPRLQLWVDDEGLDLRAPLTPADFRPVSTAPTPAADGG